MVDLLTNVDRFTHMAMVEFLAAGNSNFFIGACSHSPVTVDLCGVKVKVAEGWFEGRYLKFDPGVRMPEALDATFTMAVASESQGYFFAAPRVCGEVQKSFVLCVGIELRPDETVTNRVHAGGFWFCCDRNMRPYVVAMSDPRNVPLQQYVDEILTFPSVTLAVTLEAEARLDRALQLGRAVVIL